MKIILYLEERNIFLHIIKDTLQIYGYQGVHIRNKFSKHVKK